MTVSGAAPTPDPTPKPTPKPKPKPKPKPTAHATPAPTAAPRSTATPRPEPTPKPTAKPTSPPKVVVQPSPAPTLAPVAIGGGGSTKPPSSGDDSTRGTRSDYFAIPIDDNTTFGGLAIDVLATLGVFEWAVPAAILTVPGLLLIVVIGAQMFGAFAWLPLVRRKLGGTGVRRSGHLRGLTPK